MTNASITNAKTTRISAHGLKKKGDKMKYKRREKFFSQLSDEEKQRIASLTRIGAKEAAEFNVAVSTLKRWRDAILGHKPKKRAKKAPKYSERLTRKDSGRFLLNENPPTELTKRLILNYYAEDLNKYKMTRKQAIKDISLELGRTEEYILKILKGEK